MAVAFILGVAFATVVTWLVTSFGSSLHTFAAAVTTTDDIHGQRVAHVRRHLAE